MWRKVKKFAKYTLVGSGVTVGVLGATGWIYYTYRTRYGLQSPNSVVYAKVDDKSKEVALSKSRGPVIPPTRAQQVKNMQTPGAEYDMLVIGGGATGCGVALDATTRGLKTALVDMDDFASGTSSRSTKLIHGGIRYLYQAIWGFDKEQLYMVQEALTERANLLAIAPHLSYPLPIMLPVYKWWQVPYFWMGLKMYDVVAGRQLVKPSYFLSRRKALEQFPMLKSDSLRGAIVYYDGGHNDSRMCLSIAMTAARHGCHIANHVEVLDLLKDEADGGRICGATMRDNITGEKWTVRAKCVVNATGPFTDTIRHMDDPNTDNICQPSAGVHLVLPDYYSPAGMGLLDPATSDGRVIFFLPWENYTIAGTTDRACPVTHHPAPTEEDIQFILNEIRNYLTPDIEVRRGDVQSAWAGIRPLVHDPSSKDTASVARNHIVHVSDRKLITVAGGKWTTYRSMAIDTVDSAIKTCGLEPTITNTSVTSGLILEGGHNWTPTLFIRLVQDFGIETAVAKHLSHMYGDKAISVAKMADITGKRWPVLGTKLHDELPFIESEIKYGCRREMACTAVDIIGRRLPLSFVNVHAAEEALPRIVEIMAAELKWDNKRKKKELETAREFIHSEMGSSLGKTSRNVPINFSRDEINKHIADFNRMDKGKKGYITVNDLRQMFKSSGESITEDQLRDMLCEVDLNKNGNIDMGEYLELMSALRTGAIAYSRIALISKLQEQEAAPVEVQRSGGGV